MIGTCNEGRAELRGNSRRGIAGSGALFPLAAGAAKWKKAPGMRSSRRGKPRRRDYSYRARYYDSHLGRFLGEDPAGLNSGINLYHYVFNNPARYTDPLGLWVSGGAIGGAAGIGVPGFGGAGAAGFYAVFDNNGGWAILFCRGGGLSFGNGLGAGAAGGAAGYLCPNCSTVCDAAGTTVDFNLAGGAGLGGFGSLSLGSKTVAVAGGVGGGGGFSFSVTTTECTVLVSNRDCEGCGE